MVIIGHVLAGIGAFGPLLVMPLIARRVAAVGSGAEGQAAVAQSSLWVRRRVSEPCFVAVGLFGVLAAALHPDDGLSGYLWVQLAVAFWLIAVLVVLFVQGPLARRAERLVLTLSRGEGDAELGRELTKVSRWLELVTMVSAVGLPVMLYLMVFQPQ